MKSANFSDFMTPFSTNLVTVKFTQPLFLLSAF